MIVYVSNDNMVMLRGASVLNATTGETVYLDETATVTFRVQDLAGVDVLGETWPVTMTYLTDTDGDFLGVLRDTVALDPGREYRLVGIADNGTDQRGHWSIPLYARIRA